MLGNIFSFFRSLRHDDDDYDDDYEDDEDDDDDEEYYAARARKQNEINRKRARLEQQIEDLNQTIRRLKRNRSSEDFADLECIKDIVKSEMIVDEEIVALFNNLNTENIQDIIKQLKASLKKDQDRISKLDTVIAHINEAALDHNDNRSE